MKIEPRIQTKNAAGFYAQRDDVFGRIADRYDLLCDLFSIGIHRVWKRRVAQVMASEPWTRMLDCATGTGDIILRVLKQGQLAPDQVIIASDLSHQMLARARERIAASDRIQYQLLDAHSMPEIDTASVDLFSISLGLKICDRERVLREAFRILRPTGRLVILEASKISFPWLQNLYLRYMRLCMPIIGWIATNGDMSAYAYLLRGIEDFVDAETLAAELVSIGFEDVHFERLSLGIVAIHVARKPM